MRSSPRLADHCIIETFASRGCNGSVGESRVGFLLIFVVVFIETVCKFLLIGGPVAIVRVILLGVQDIRSQGVVATARAQSHLSIRMSQGLAGYISAATIPRIERVHVAR